MGEGKLSAVIAALITTVSFDFFFIPPRFLLRLVIFNMLLRLLPWLWLELHLVL